MSLCRIHGFGLVFYGIDQCGVRGASGVRVIRGEIAGSMYGRLCRFMMRCCCNSSRETGRLS